MKSAGVTALASRAAVSLVNNDGDLGRVLQEMGSSESVKAIVTSMLTAGEIKPRLQDARNSIDTSLMRNP